MSDVKKDEFDYALYAIRRACRDGRTVGNDGKMAESKLLCWSDCVSMPDKKSKQTKRVGLAISALIQSLINFESQKGIFSVIECFEKCISFVKEFFPADVVTFNAVIELDIDEAEKYVGPLSTDAFPVECIGDFWHGLKPFNWPGIPDSVLKGVPKLAQFARRQGGWNIDTRIQNINATYYRASLGPTIRERCVLIIGNGFSIGLLKCLNLDGKIDPSNFLEVPSNAKLLRYPGLTTDEQPLTEAMFPELFSEYKKSPDPMTFCRHIRAQDAISLDKSSGRFSIETFSLTIELRRFLWCLFTFYDQILKQELNSELHRIKNISSLLVDLCRKYELIVVSFNYESLFERICQLVGLTPLISGCASSKYFNFRKPQELLVLKPHGSVSFETNRNLFGDQGFPNHSFTNCVFQDVAVDKPNFDLPKVPLIPDLVPPGHADDQRITFDTDVDYCVSHCIEHCDKLIVWGFSGNDPDTQEAERYLSRIKKPINSYHMSFNDPSTDEIARIMQTACANYQLILNEDLSYATKILGKELLTK